MTIYNLNIWSDFHNSVFKSMRVVALRLFLVLFNIFAGGMDSWKKCSLSKFADDSKVSDALWKDILEGKDTICRPWQAWEVGLCEPHEF